MLFLTSCDDAPPTAPTAAAGATNGGASGSSTGGTDAVTAGSGGGGGGATSGGSGAGGAAGTTSGAGGGGSGAGGSGSAGLSGSGGGGGGSAFVLTSPDLVNGGTFQDKNTCNGKAFGDDESPALTWTEPPAGTKSFALTFIDVTLTANAPANPLGHHWMAYDIPAATRALPGGLPDGTTLTTPVPLKQVPQSYLGPCPGGAMDTYELRLYALEVEKVDPGAGGALTKAMVDEIKAASLGSAVLSGKSDAKSK